MEFFFGTKFISISFENILVKNCEIYLKILYFIVFLEVFKFFFFNNNFLEYIVLTKNIFVKPNF